MNKCFFIGKMIEKENLKFILNKKKKHKSQITGKMQLLDETIVNFVGYDEMADYIYRNEFEYIYISGSLIELNNLFYIEIEEIKKVIEFDKYLKIENMYEVN